jgi:hypothetical protein
MIAVEEPKCVKMKHEIQARLAKDFEGMSHEEIRAEQERRIKNNPFFGKLSEQWRVVNPDAGPEGAAEKE